MEKQLQDAGTINASNEKFYSNSKFNATIMFMIGIGLSLFSYFIVDNAMDPTGFFSLIIGIALMVMSFSLFLQGHYYARKSKYSAVSARIKKLRFS